MSRCPSICVLHSWIKTNKASVMISSSTERGRGDSQANLRISSSSRNSKRGHPQARALNEMRMMELNGDGYELEDYVLSRCISETVRDTTKLITNRKSHTRLWLVPNSTTLDDPELTLNSHYTLCYIHTSFGANHKNLNEDIDPYYRRQNVAQGS